MVIINKQRQPASQSASSTINALHWSIRLDLAGTVSSNTVDLAELDTEHDITQYIRVYCAYTYDLCSWIARIAAIPSYVIMFLLV